MVRESPSEKGPLSQALEGKVGESQGQAQGLRGTRSDLQFGCEMEGVLEGKVGSKETGEGADGIQVTHQWVTGDGSLDCRA